MDMDRVLEIEFLRDGGCVTHGNRRYRKRSHEPIYHPDRGWNLCLDEETMRAVHAYHEAELYRKAIVDQELPLWPRVDMVYLLGLIGYKAAGPELREVMLHAQEPDGHTGIYKGVAVGAITMVEYREAITDMIRILEKDEEPFSDIVTALGIFRDPRALDALRQHHEAAVFRAGLKVGQDEMPGSMDYFTAVKTLCSIIRIGGRYAQECIDNLYHSPYGFIVGIADEAKKRVRLGL